MDCKALRGALLEICFSEDGYVVEVISYLNGFAGSEEVLLIPRLSKRKGMLFSNRDCFMIPMCCMRKPFKSYGSVCLEGLGMFQSS